MDQIEQLKQDGGQRTPRASGLRQQTEVFESIEIDLDWQLRGRAFTVPLQQLCKVSVVMPTNARELCPIFAVQSNEVAATAMIRA
jgi:hypothetical protein